MREVAERLKEKGIRVALDESDERPGQSTTGGR